MTPDTVAKLFWTLFAADFFTIWIVLCIDRCPCQVCGKDHQ